MPDEPLTLMAVHAHPDDEGSTTGGVLARYADEGVRTVLVTCTNGELGDGPGGAKPGEPGHDTAEVVGLRRKELEESCRVLGVEHLELLGYHDSGMMGWPQNEARSLAPRCRLITSWGCSRSQGFGCSPIKVVRELGSKRRQHCVARE